MILKINGNSIKRGVMMGNSVFLIFVLSISFLAHERAGRAEDGVVGFTDIAGRPTQSSIVLKTMLAASDTLVCEMGSVDGVEGFARFEIDRKSDFRNSFKTDWKRAEAENGYTIQQMVDGLEAGTKYYYRSIVALDTLFFFAGKTRQFRTLPSLNSNTSLSFTISTCMHYEKFMMGLNRNPEVSDNRHNTRASDEDRRLGYPALQTIYGMQPLFHIFNGDNVYYDPRWSPRAKTASEMRNYWHQLFSFPRFRQMAGTISTYWTKDDHDFRYNDCDTTDYSTRVDDGSLPSAALGMAMFREQVPVANPQDPGSKTYGTYRLNQLLQIWIVETRDYRSPNFMEDGPLKSIWGSEQREWLKRTLLESDAEFKLLISSTPMIGPEYGNKNDNHAAGFKYERDLFFQWLTDHGFRDRNFYIIHGDRHWQYHAIHPGGIEEFSSGPFHIQNIAPNGPHPGDPHSTDPQGLIVQPYHQKIGGFIRVDLIVEAKELVISFFDEWGGMHYQSRKMARTTMD